MVSCSCFAPTPSMAAMLVNRFKFKESVLTYNLSGMGCSSSLVCVDLAHHLLKVHLLPQTSLCCLCCCLPATSTSTMISQYPAHAAPCSQSSLVPVTFKASCSASLCQGC